MHIHVEVFCIIAGVRCAHHSSQSFICLVAQFPDGVMSIPHWSEKFPAQAQKLWFWSGWFQLSIICCFSAMIHTNVQSLNSYWFDWCNYYLKDF